MPSRASRDAWLIHAIVLAWLLWSPSTAAQESRIARFTLPGYGVLQLKVPATWLSIVRQPAKEGLPTIVLTPSEGLQFELTVTASARDAKESAAAAEQSARASVERLMQEVAPNAAETNLRVEKLQGATAKGFYFAATDKSPKPNDYAHLMQGVVNLSQLRVSFTLLTHDKAEDVVAATLDSLRTATVTRAAK